jgi:hypothetical protein
MEKLSLTGDLWYAGKPEKVNGEDELGFEVDLLATYQLVEGLNLDLVGAYLFAGDAVSLDGKNDEDPGKWAHACLLASNKRDAAGAS